MELLISPVLQRSSLSLHVTVVAFIQCDPTQLHSSAADICRALQIKHRSQTNVAEMKTHPTTFRWFRTYCANNNKSENGKADTHIATEVTFIFQSERMNIQ